MSINCLDSGFAAINWVSAPESLKMLLCISNLYEAIKSFKCHDFVDDPHLGCLSDATSNMNKNLPILT